MNKRTIALCVIARNEEGKIGKMLESVLPFVDSFYLTDTGSEDKTIEEAQKSAAKHDVEFHLSHFDWINDFGAARNFNFAQVKGEDWTLWLDCDDTLVGGDKLASLTEFADLRNIHGFAFLYHYEHDENGNVRTIHWKERLLRTGQWFTWKGRIHESVIREGDKESIVKIEEVHVKHNATPKMQLLSAGRNLKILMETVEAEKKAGEEDPRTLYLLANAQLLLGEFSDAETTLIRYLELSGWDEERYQALQLLGEIHENHTKDYNKALNVYLSSLKERPEFPDAYFNIARTNHRKGDHQKALFWTKIGYERGRPDTNLIWFPQNYTWKPAIIAGYSALQLGDVDLAQKYATYAKEHNPTDEYVKTFLDLVEHTAGRRDVAMSFSKIVDWMEKKGEKNKILPLLGMVPKDHISDPIISNIKKRYIEPQKWAKETVVIYCTHTAEPWSPKSVERGIGGSEEAVINLAQQWTKLGYSVTVYNWCDDEHGNYDGVEYKNYWDFNPEDHFDTIIVWRTPEVVDLIQHAKRIYLDLHDVPNPSAYTKERLEKIDKIFVKTKYQRQFLPQIPDDKFVIVGNGINPEHFEGKVSRNPKKLIYSSSFDRGLEHLLEMWPDIRKEVKDAELHIFYGWDLFVKFHSANPERMAWKEKMDAKMQQPGIHFRGRIGHKEIAKEFMSAGVWAYPTDFEEIHCITACKAQAAGTFPIVTDYAALKETILRGEKIPGDPWSQEFRDKFVSAVTATLMDDDLKERNQLSHDAKKVFAWSSVAKIWSNYF